jgi:hypothetical protein
VNEDFLIETVHSLYVDGYVFEEFWEKMNQESYSILL